MKGLPDLHPLPTKNKKMDNESYQTTNIEETKIIQAIIWDSLYSFFSSKFIIKLKFKTKLLVFVII